MAPPFFLDHQKVCQARSVVEEGEGHRGEAPIETAVAASKLKGEKGNKALLATTTKSVTCSTTKVYITDPALRKWVLKNDPRCRIINAKIVRCIPCNRKITLEDVYYLSAWFRHIEKSATHQRREKEWAVGASIDRDTLFKKAPKMSDLPIELKNAVTETPAKEVSSDELADSEVPGVGEETIAEKEDVGVLKVTEEIVPEAVSVEVRKEAEEPIAAQAVEGSDDEESDNWLGFQYLHRHGATTASSSTGDMECQCTSLDGGCEHGPFSLCAKGSDCTVVVCTHHLEAAYLYIV
ncbi:hypothetical protein DFP72DRAFT_851227 [Ephemerocybe angulata]|uniref:Uncharacterized protein n=1 Tax=Ephemerocybe angulata TaxID=980116 RepID=A0A8H6HRE7_9AGAR|nr:hypothetical protein DFP72DRAFT_851227 [Tulosesus angulatus]